MKQVAQRNVRANASQQAVDAVPQPVKPETTDCSERVGDCAARVDMAKAKCVHPDRPVAKACGDCPRRK